VHWSVQVATHTPLLQACPLGQDEPLQSVQPVSWVWQVATWVPWHSVWPRVQTLLQLLMH
jgi:hypothetical protein